MANAIEADGLIKTYGKDVKALDGLSFSVEEGTVFALLGPNGAGKTTAVKILTTLTRPDAGSAAVAGIDVVGRPDRVRRSIGVVSQGSGVDIQATGRENIRLQGQIFGLRAKQLDARADELLARFGLADAADRIARGYSGGCSDGSTSRWRWCTTPTSCSWTSRPPASIPRSAPRCGS